MGLLDLFRRQSSQAVSTSNAPRAEGPVFYGWDDPALHALLTMGQVSSTGISVSVERAMRIPAVYRSVALISQSIGMLPLHLVDKETKEKAKDHPLFRVLHRKPNAWQTAFEFRSLMQLRVVVRGNAYARIIRGPDVEGTPRGQKLRKKIIGLIPLDPAFVKPVQNNDWSLSYEYRPAQGDKVVIPAADMLHLRNQSSDGITGESQVRQAADAIGIAIAADLALGRVFKNGSFVDGTLEAPSKLSQEAYERLRQSWAERYGGAGNAGTTPVLEEGLKYSVVGTTAKDAQFHETRGRQVEEIARIFGVPRPLLMVDETSWGSGIAALGQFFVQFGLNPWFEAWQQAIERSCLTDEEADRLEVKFNPGGLLRGSMADQADFLAKALGAGGHQPWMWADEARDFMDLPKRDAPPNTMMGHNGGPALTP